MLADRLNRDGTLGTDGFLEKKLESKLLVGSAAVVMIDWPLLKGCILVLSFHGFVNAFFWT